MEGSDGRGAEKEVCGFWGEKRRTGVRAGQYWLARCAGGVSSSYATLMGGQRMVAVR